jgi:hypothetical protein
MQGLWLKPSAHVFRIPLRGRVKSSEEILMRDHQVALSFRCLIAIAALMSGACSLAFADDRATAVQAGSAAPATAAEAKGPTIEAVYVDAAPTIDGQLDDPCWSKATRVEGLYCAEWNAPAPEETTALICADGRGLYVAVICNDRTPEDIVANETRRNGDLSEDDCIAVVIDPTGQRRDSYNFQVNAAGAQAENIPGNSATKIEWRGDWTAAAVRTEDGWQAEVAIPFSILRRPPGQTTFSFAVARDFSRERVSGIWPDMGPTTDFNLCADLVGLRPRSEARRRILMPYLTVDVGDTDDSGVDAGVDAQYQLASGLTLLGVVNPDYKQIEDVVEPISFSYTERYLLDPRPFFVTGQSKFLPREHLLYTRRVQDFDAGVKLFGKVGDEAIGILDAITFGEENTAAAAWKHHFDEDNWARISAVSHHENGEPDDLATEFSAGRTWRRPEGSDSLWLVAYGSHEQGRGSGSAYSIGGSHDRGYGRIAYDWMLRRVSPDFSPALGYYPYQNSIGGELNLRQIDFFENGPVEARQVQLNMHYFPFLEGKGIFSSGIAPGYFVRTRSAHLYGVILDYGRYSDYNDSGVTVIYAWNDSDLYRRGEVNLVHGRAGGGDLTYYKLDQGLRPMDRLSVRVSAEHISLAMPDGTEMDEHQAVLTTSYDVTPEKTIAARAIWRDAGSSAYASYRQVVRKGMDAYVIVGDPDPSLTGFTERVVLKLIWAL